jgi:hypothetical protein
MMRGRSATDRGSAAYSFRNKSYLNSCAFEIACDFRLWHIAAFRCDAMTSALRAPTTDVALPRTRSGNSASTNATALLAVSSADALGQGTIIRTNAIMVVERTQYVAKPGLATEVLDLRRKASAVPFRSAFQSEKYSSNIIVVMEASLM